MHCINHAAIASGALARCGFIALGARLFIGRTSGQAGALSSGLTPNQYFNNETESGLVVVPVCRFQPMFLGMTFNVGEPTA